MCFGGDEVKPTYDGPTTMDKANLDIARENQDLYNQYFKGIEGQYLQDIQENLGGFAENQAASDVAQGIYASKQGSGPALANRGQATGIMATYGQAHGSGLAAGVTKADTLGNQAVVDQNMIALQNASGLGANISSNAQQMATASTSSAIQASNTTFNADIKRYADQSELMADAAGAVTLGLGNKFKTGSFLGTEEGGKTGWGGSTEGSLQYRIGKKYGLGA